ncbi:MAG: helix-turn-helix transcriptional regulator [Leptospira sp.]|nr:helix-turn-helix transcriptional regulator [Leptospira sp.]
MVILATFLGFGCLQCLHLALSYWKRRNLAYKSKFLVLFFLVLAVTFFCNFIYTTEFVRSVPHLTKLGYLLGTVTPPLYILGLWEYYQISWRRKLWLPIFFLPTVLLLLYLLPFLFKSGEEKILFLNENQGETLQSESQYLMLYVLVSNTLVLILYFFRVSDYKAIPLPPFERLVFLYFQIFLVLWHLTGIVVFLLMPTKTWQGIFNLGFSVWTIVYSYVRLYTEERDEANPDTPIVGQYQKSRLKEEKLVHLGEKISVVLAQSDVVYDSELSLDQLSRLVGASTHEISQVCRRYFQKTFWELIREKRIQKAKEFLLSTDWPVLRIGLEVGYESKSAFYKAFQEQTKTTPVEFRKNNPFSSHP